MKTIIIKDKIKEYFFVHPTQKLRLRQIERALKVHLPSVIRYVHELEQEGIVKKIKIATVIFYAADRSSHAFLLEKRAFNLRALYTSGLIDFLKQELSNPTIIVFGSYAKGEDIEDSDVDLYVETPSQKEIHFEKFEKVLQRKIQVFTYANIHRVTNIHLANNIINGTLLNGFLEVFV